MITYNFCPECGARINESTYLIDCKNCGSVYYRNAKPCASVLPIKDGQVLLARRGQKPYKGAYDIIGGFMEVDEHPEQAAIREAKEETGLDVAITKLLGIYVDRYGDDGDYTLNLHYIGEVTGGNMQPMDDVAALEWVPIEDVPLRGGFQNTRDGLRDLKNWYRSAGVSGLSKSSE